MDDNFIKWFILCVTQKYATFNGRARRKEYWMFCLVYFVLSFIAAMVHEYLNLILVLVLFVPSLAVAVRRLHDIGKSAGWFLILLIPIIGWIYFLYLMIKNSIPGENQYGPNPKGIEYNL